MRTPAFRLALAVAAAAASVAWSPTGHRAVGRIAEHHLTESAARAITAMLAPEQLAYVTTWADEIRSEPDWAKAESWHWVTVPDGQTYESAAKNPSGDILESIARFEGVLSRRGAPQAERVQALKWLSHLVGDLHQPLHVGRGDDHGGNDVMVLWFGEPTNLHSVWDDKLIDSSHLSFSELSDMLDRTTPEQLRDWQRGGPRDWAEESKRLRDQCYELGDRKLGFRYIHDQWPAVERRLLQAGIRLAGELNRLLGAP